MTGGFLLLLALANGRFAQVPPSPTPDAAVAHAAAAITGADLVAYQAALLADSMQGRAPSAAADRAAQYAAAQLRALGFAVEPSTDVNRSIFPFTRRHLTGGIYRYPVPTQFRVDYRQSHLDLTTTIHGSTAAVVMENGGEPREQSLRIPLAGTARVLDTVTALPLILSAWSIWSGGMANAGILLAGRHSLVSVQAVDVQRRLVVYVPPPDADSATQAAIVQDLAARSGGVVVVTAADSAAFAVQQQAAQARPPSLLPSGWSTGRAWAVEVQHGAVDRMLRKNGVDLAELRTEATRVVRQLPFLTASLTWAAAPVMDTVTASNVVAVLPDSELGLVKRWERPNYVIVAASLDGEAADSASNALNVASLLMLAKAFSQPGAQPRCSLVFLVTSDGTAQWGSRDFLARTPASAQPTLAVKLDLGRSRMDTVLAVDGARDVEGASTLAWVGALHPELGVALVDTGSVLSSDTGVSAFTDRWVPTLVFRPGSSGAPPQRGAATGEKVVEDTATAVRVLRTLFYTIRMLADADPPMQWTAAARRRLSEAHP